MRKSFATLLFAACLLVGTTGCAFMTTGGATWEIYSGVRTQQTSEEPSKVEIQSSVVDKVVESLTETE